MPSLRRLCLVVTCLASVASLTLAQQPKWKPIDLPIMRKGVDMAYDFARDRIVRFGGSRFDPTRTVYFGDTSEFDGLRWHHLVVAGPPERAWHQMVYDIARQRVVLFGGENGSKRYRDTWEWDGKVWRERKPTTAPPSSRGAMCYDSVRQRTIFYSGTWSEGVWEWDGSNWKVTTAKSGPPTRTRHAIAFDPFRRRIMLFGGLKLPHGIADTWEWDGAAWKQVGSMRAGIFGHDMEWEPGRQQIVAHTPYETWGWTGKTWSRISTTITPRAGRMVYDPRRLRLVLWAQTTHGLTYNATSWSVLDDPRPQFGRFGSMVYDASRRRAVLLPGANLFEVWEYASPDWIRLRPWPAPPPRANAAMVYDTQRRRVLLFGGVHLNSPSQSDTWEWDGRSWVHHKPALSPPVLQEHGMAYEVHRDRTLLFGGSPPNSSSSRNETWEWNGKSWTRLSPVTSPPARRSHAMVYDIARKRIVVFGGYSGRTALRDTREWDGRTWTQRRPTTVPPGDPMRATYDVGRQRVLLATWNYYTSSSQTWEWDGTNWTRTTPTGASPRRVDALAYDSDRMVSLLLSDPKKDKHLYEFDSGARTLIPDRTTLSSLKGGSVKFQLAAGAASKNARYVIFGSSSGPLPGSPLPGFHVFLNVDSYTVIAFASGNSSIFQNFTGTLDANARATATLNVPPLPSSLSLHHSFATWDGSTGRVLEVSNPVPLRIR